MRKWFRKLAGGLVLAAVGWNLLTATYAQAPASAPAGFHRIQLLGNSDTLVSLPFTRPTAASGLVASFANNVVTLTGNSPWSGNQFVYAAGVQTNTYYMLIASGALEGFGATITGNGVNSLTLQLGGGSLNGLQAGDRVMVIPYWTLASVFPGGAAVHVSPDLFERNTEVLIPNLTGPGINLSASKTYYFSETHWRLFGQPTEVKDDDLLSPSAYFIVRHNVAGDTTLTVRGSVTTSKWAVSLRTNPLRKQDNFVALPRPAALTLNESGLIVSGAFASSPDLFSRTDELFTFDNTQRKKNKSASGTYFYSEGKWQKFPDPTDVGTLPILTPGTGVIIRKSPAASGPVWLNTPNY